MHCVKRITDDLTWIGADDRRLAMFEGVYSVPAGVSYNAYLLKDEKNVLFDTVDKAVRHKFLDNLAYALGSESLDYIVVHHVEPDHSALLQELVVKYPGAKVVCNRKIAGLLQQFYDFDITPHTHLVDEGDTLVVGKHHLHFVNAPMVHWPEVMVTYESTDKILFSADAFGCFGALNGAIFADEVDFARDYMDEARRYYTNIVGKYGAPVQTLLNKAATLDIRMICPLHGFVWRDRIGDIVAKYDLWSRYEPEEQGVMIAYASVYGHTENAVEVLSARLRDKGVKTVMYDVSVTPASEIIAAAFKWSHMVLASTTYNAGIFVTMEALVNDLVAHNIQNRTVAVIENGSWAPTSGDLIREKLSECQNLTLLSPVIRIASSLKNNQLVEMDTLVEAITQTLPASASKKPTPTAVTPAKVAATALDANTLFKLSYGLYILTAKEGDKDNGCVINTAQQLTSSPQRISVAVNKANYTHDMILKTNLFNVSVLDTRAPFSLFKQFGFSSGKDTDKFAEDAANTRTVNGLRYISEYTNGVISAHVTEALDYGTHTLFVGDITQAFILSNEPSVTYQYYFDHIKPKPPQPGKAKKGFVCKICGYIHEGDTLPDDFICPLCKHGAEDFEPL